MRNSNKHNSPPVAQQRPNAPGPRRDNNHQHTTAAAPLRPPVFAPPERHKETHGKHTHTLGPGQDEDRQVESLQKTQTNQKERKKRAAEEARDEQEATKRRERERERERRTGSCAKLWKATHTRNDGGRGQTTAAQQQAGSRLSADPR